MPCHELYAITHDTNWSRGESSGQPSSHYLSSFLPWSWRQGTRLQKRVKFRLPLLINCEHHKKKNAYHTHGCVSLNDTRQLEQVKCFTCCCVVSVFAAFLHCLFTPSWAPYCESCSSSSLCSLSTALWKRKEPEKLMHDSLNSKRKKLHVGPSCSNPEYVYSRLKPFTNKPRKIFTGFWLLTFNQASIFCLVSLN